MLLLYLTINSAFAALTELKTSDAYVIVQIKYHSQAFEKSNGSDGGIITPLHFNVYKETPRVDSQCAHACRNLHKLGLPVCDSVQQLTPGNEHAASSQPLQRDGVEFQDSGMQGSQVRGQSHLLRGLPLEG